MAAFNNASRDQRGVTISNMDGIDFGVVEIEDAQRGVANTLVISYPGCWPLPLPLQYDREVILSVVFRQTLRGRFEDRLEITFEDTASRHHFIVVRLLKAIVGNKADYELLRPTCPYVPNRRIKWQPESDIIPGPAAAAVNTIRWATPLPQAYIPKSLTFVLIGGYVSNIVKQLKRGVLPEVITKDTHGRHYKSFYGSKRTEWNRRRDLQIYDIYDAQLERFNQYYYLRVPGLAERRPSVLMGDRILVQRHGAASGQWFEGHVHVVRKDEVGLRFHGSFSPPTRGQLHNVHFKLNRIPLRRQHQALDTTFVEGRIVYPGRQHIANARRFRMAINTFNPQVATNPRQLDPVRTIVHRPPGSVPFVVFGPPGTGKTMTIIEAIRQVLRTPNTRILACAPSNSAADLIASKLTVLGKERLYRYNSPSRSKDTVPDELLPFSSVNADGHFSLAPMDFLRRFRVIVSTCVSASFVHNIGLPRGHFTHIFVDEAGHATEPEVMIAIKTLVDQNTNVILSGDPKQLGPIIRSAVARNLQLDMSYLERLMNLPIYDEEEGHGISVVKLTKNYRSHPAILRYPNERPRAIVCHAMSGKDAREASSPSFFNVEEVLQVKAYVEALRSDRRFRIADKEIGIIAPYHAQCLKIRTVLRPFAEGIKVGSTEEFQGQERRVMIISTMRSSRDFVEYDLKHTLGFVANPRRFNVAVTRAQALLIIIGDPSVLSLDLLWRSFSNYVHTHGGWKGIPISWDPQAIVREEGGYDAELRAAGLADMNNFAERMQALTLESVTDADADEMEEAEANVERPWRVVE